MAGGATFRVRGARRHIPVAPFVIAVALALIAALVMTHSDERVALRTSAEPHVPSASLSEDWSFLSSPVVRILREREEMPAAEFVDAWAREVTGLTVREVLRDPLYLRILRHAPQLSARDVIRIEARGS